MVAVLVLALLIVSIPVLIFWNQSSARGQVLSQSKQQARSIAQGGIAQAITMMTQNNCGPQSNNGCFPPYFGSLPAGLDGSQVFQSLGGVFSVSCSLGGPPPQNFSWEETCISSATFGNTTATYQAAISVKTLGTNSPDGILSQGALEIFNPPQINASGTLDVEWGPVVLYSTTTWVVTGPMDQYQYPRKLAEGGIQGSLFERSPLDNPPTTDNAEYWAYLNLGYAPDISVNWYSVLAQVSTFTVTPVLYLANSPSSAPAPASPTEPESGGNGIPYTPADGNPPAGRLQNLVIAAPSNPGNSGYIQSGGGGATVLFDGAGSGYSVGQSSSVVVVGNAEMQNVAINVAPSNGVIVNGDLWMGGGCLSASCSWSGGAFSGTFASKRSNSGLCFNNPAGWTVPQTAPGNYPYYPSNPTSYVGSTYFSSPGTPFIPPWWCSGSGNPVSGSALPSIRGFLYVTGDLYIEPNNNVVIIGAVRVDGTIKIGAGASLSIYYDDVVNHKIRVTPTQLITNSETEIN